MRPECEREAERIEIQYGDEIRGYETAATVPSPEPPAEFTADAIVDFVDEFERAYVTRDALCDRTEPPWVLDVHYGLRESESWGQEPTIVVLLRTGAVGSLLHEDGSVSVADVAPSGVIYAVDETGAARVADDDAAVLEPEAWDSDAADLLAEGEFVAAFE